MTTATARTAPKQIVFRNCLNLKTCTDLICTDSVPFPTKTRKISHRPLHSRLRLTLVISRCCQGPICRGPLCMNIQRSITHLHSHCFAHSTFCFCFCLVGFSLPSSACTCTLNSEDYIYSKRL